MIWEWFNAFKDTSVPENLDAPEGYVWDITTSNDASWVTIDLEVAYGGRVVYDPNKENLTWGLSQTEKIGNISDLPLTVRRAKAKILKGFYKNLASEQRKNEVQSILDDLR